MSLQYYLRLALVGLTLSVVGCLPEVSMGTSPMPLGDVTDDSKIKLRALEGFKSVNPTIQDQTRDSLQRSLEQFNSKPQPPSISSDAYNQRKEVKAKNPSLSPTETRASADVIYPVPNKVKSDIIYRKNPVEFPSTKFNEETDAKRSYAFQTVQQEQNPLDVKGSQMSSSDINLAPRLVRKKGGMNAANMHRSGSFRYQPIFKSEMHSGSSRSLEPNEPYLRENIPTNYMPRTVNHNIMHKSDGNILLDHFLQNNGRNQNVLRRVVPANTTPLISTAIQHERKPLPQALPAGTGVNSQNSYENMRDATFSKVKPPTILTPVVPAFKSSKSNGGHGILPIKKSKLFSAQHDHVKLSNSERLASPNLQSGFEYGNAKPATSSYALKDIKFAQNGYQNSGQSSLNGVSTETFRNQKKYDNLPTGAVRPPVTNNARSELLKWSKQNTDVPPRMQFTENAVLFSESDKNINLPDPTNHPLRRPSQHNTQNRTHLNYLGQSTVQSLSVKHFPAPSLVPGSTMKSPSVSGTQGTSKNSGTSSSGNRPYYLTSKKPYGLGFTFVPALQTSLQTSEMHSGQKPLLESLSNAPARPQTGQSALVQKPLTHQSYQKTLFQFKEIESSQEKSPYWDQTHSFDNVPQREPISSTGGVNKPLPDALKHHAVRGQAVAMKTSLFGTHTTNRGAVDEVQSKASQRWTSSRFASAQPTGTNRDEFPTVSSFVESNLNQVSVKSSSSHTSPTSELVLPIVKSTLLNKVAGNAVIQPFRRYSLTGHEISAQSNTGQKYRPIGLRPSSTVVTDLNHKNVYAIPNSQFAIYRSADVNRHKTSNSAKLTYQSPIYRSSVKPTVKANIQQANTGSAWREETSPIPETDINLKAVGVSQALRPTSSFVVGKYINTLDTTSTKPNFDTHSTKSGLHNYKPLQFSDIVGSASFTDAKLYSAGTTATKEVDLRSDTNSTSVMEKSFKKLVFESTVDLHVPELIPTAVTGFTTQSQLSSLLTEDHTPPQSTVYSSQLDPGNQAPPTAEDMDPFYEETLKPNTTSQD